MFGIEHIGIFSKDSEALKNWYADLFGWTQVYANEEKKTYFLKADDGMMIEFCKSGDDGGILGDKVTGIRHIAISVDDFDAAVAKVNAAGVEIVTEPALSASGVGTMFFRDPDGNVLHLIYRTNKL